MQDIVINGEVTPKGDVDQIAAVIVTRGEEIVMNVSSRGTEHTSAQSYTEASEIDDRVVCDFDLATTGNGTEECKILTVVGPVADDPHPQRLMKVHVGAAGRVHAGRDRISLVGKLVVGND